MTEPELLAPCCFSNSSFELCKVNISETGNSALWRPDNGDKNARHKLNALQNYFNKKSEIETSGVKITIRSIKNKLNEVIFSKDTPSVFLGIFLKASREILQREFKNSWDYIIATGDINPHDGAIKPEAVTHIKEKHKSAVEFAKNYPDKKILFIYIHNEEKTPVEHGMAEEYKNIEVMVFTQNNTMGEIAASVFEPKFNNTQKILLLKCEKISNRPERYIPTKTYKNLTKKARLPGWNGAFIHGQGGSGKSAMALELAYWLMEREYIYAPVWIYLNNHELQIINAQKRNIRFNKKGKIIKNNDSITEYLASLIAEQLEIPDINFQQEENLEILRSKLAEKNIPYLLVIDNLECPLANEILKSLKKIIYICEVKQPVIVTSRIEKRPGVFNDELELEIIQPDVLTEDEVEELIRNTAKKLKLEDRLIESEDNPGYGVFINKVYNHFSKLPGMIELIVPLLKNKKMSELQPILLSFDYMSLGQEDIDKKITRIYEAILDDLDEITQAVLYSFLSVAGNKNETKNEMPLQDRLFINIKKSEIILQNTELKGRIEKELRELELRHLIYKIDAPSGTLKFGIENLTYVSLMFNSKFKGKQVFSKKHHKKISLRDALVDPVNFVISGIRHNQPVEILKPALNRLKKKQIRKNYFLHRAAIMSDICEHINVLLEYDNNLCRKRDKFKNKTPLHLAAEYNKKPDMVKILIKNEKHKFITDAHGNTPFHYAAEDNEYPENIDLLLDKNKKLLNLRNYEGDAPLHLAAAYNNNPLIIEKLLELGAEYDIKDQLGFTPAHLAAFNENLGIIKTFLRNNREVLFFTDMYGCTPINYILMNESITISWLKENNIDINGSYGLLEAPLPHTAAVNENIMIFKAFLNDNADFLATDLEGTTIMHNAAFNSNYDAMKEIITILIEKGLSINAVNLLDTAPLHCAAMFNENPKCVLFLLENGAKKDLNKKNKMGFKPLDYAIMYNDNPEIALLLINEGANINEKFSFIFEGYEEREKIFLSKSEEWAEQFLEANYRDLEFLAGAGNWTPLHCAAIYDKNYKIVKFLLEKNANIRATDADGDTPLHLAAIYNKNLEVIITLMEKDPSILKLKNNYGKTPLYYLKNRKDWKDIRENIKNFYKHNQQGL